MGTIKLDAVQVTGRRVSYDYSVSDDIKKYFNQSQAFFIEYDEDIITVPDAILAIPFLANFLPIAWTTDSTLTAREANKDFVEHVDAIKQAYVTMFPLASFGGSLTVQNKVDCSYKNSGQTAAFFSGGVDSFCTLIRNRDKNPTLMTLWGSDIFLTDLEGWNKVQDSVIHTAQTFNVAHTFIKSSFRQVLNYKELDRLASSFTHKSWWGSLQHGLAICAHSVAYVWLHKISTQYIGASYCSNDKSFHNASCPSIDENITIASCHTVHDSFDCDRQQKIDKIIAFNYDTGLSLPLRVCWSSKGGGNCCHCEKCYRSIMAIVVAGAKPKDFGFDIDITPRILKQIKTFVIWHDPHGNSLDYFWTPIKSKVKNNKKALKQSGIYKDIKWLLDIDFAHIQNNRYRKRQQQIVNIKITAKKFLPKGLFKIIKKQSD